MTGNVSVEMLEAAMNELIKDTQASGVIAKQFAEAVYNSPSIQAVIELSVMERKEKCISAHEMLARNCVKMLMLGYFMAQVKKIEVIQ